jgi:radical SAM protein with 4Fe4S-binding SPASM domain
MVLKEERIRTIVSEELMTAHGFSVDGIKPSTVEALRRNIKLDTVLENIRMLVRVRKEQEKRKPSIVIRYVLMRSSIEELPEAVRCWGEMGVEELACNYLHRTDNIDQMESLFFHQDLMEKVFGEARRVAADYPGLALSLPPTIRQEEGLRNKPRSCGSPWNFVFVDTNGGVYPCYSSAGVSVMGNLFQEGQRFRGIWNNAQYQNLRRTANEDSIKKHFSYCSVCQSRFGWGDIKVHLGDEVWFQHIGVDERTKSRIIANRHRKPLGRILT